MEEGRGDGVAANKSFKRKKTTTDETRTLLFRVWKGFLNDVGGRKL